jgi:tetratricopeptide (TPR) repeat protein
MNSSTDPSAIELRMQRARRLEELGRTDEAREAYVELIRLAPDNFEALNNFGNLLARSGFRKAARLCYAEAIKRHPENPIAYVNLANSYLENDEPEAAREQYVIALELAPDLPEAHQGLSYVLERLGAEEDARQHRERGFRDRAVSALPYRGEGTPIPVLLLLSARGGNIRTTDFLDEKVFATSRVFTEFFSEGSSLPEHAFVFNAIADADLDATALHAARGLVERTAAPTINAPSVVLRTERRACAELLGRLPDVVAPKIVLLSSREQLGRALAGQGLSFPLLLRAPGHHTGRYFEMVTGPDDLPAIALQIPGKRLLAIEYLDARSDDGNVRKYRVMIVDGKIYPLHLAISSAWKVHFFTAEGSANAAHRAEDERFLRDMDGVLGARAVSALGRIAKTLQLDYAGVDFGLGRCGEVLLFEANAAMTVLPPDRDEKWDYRRPHVERILLAVRTMLMNRIEGRAP